MLPLERSLFYLHFYLNLEEITKVENDKTGHISKGGAAKQI